MAKSDIGYILLRLWLNYVNSNSGNVRIDRYRKANLLNQMIALVINALRTMGEDTRGLEEELERAQYIINNVFRQRLYEQKFEEFYRYARGPVQVALPKEMIIRDYGCRVHLPWGAFTCVVDVYEYVVDLVKSDYLVEAEQVMKAISEMLMGVEIGNLCIKDSSGLKRFWDEVHELKLVVGKKGIYVIARIYDLTYKEGRSKLLPFNMFGFMVPGSYVSDFRVLKQPDLPRKFNDYSVVGVGINGAILRYYHVLTDSEVMQLLDHYANLVMVEAIKRGLITRELLRGVYFPLGGEDEEKAYAFEAY